MSSTVPSVRPSDKPEISSPKSANEVEKSHVTIMEARQEAGNNDKFEMV